MLSRYNVIYQEKRSNFLKGDKKKMLPRTKSLKYLEEQRKKLNIRPKEQRSNLKLRLIGQQHKRNFVELKNNSSLSDYACTVLRFGPSDANGELLKQIKKDRARSISEVMSDKDREIYDKLHDKNLRRERSQLSHSRFAKMKHLILKEVAMAIPEADHEPTVTVEKSMFQSILLQQENDMLGLGNQPLPHFADDLHQSTVIRQTEHVLPAFKPTFIEEDDQRSTMDQSNLVKIVDSNLNVVLEYNMKQAVARCKSEDITPVSINFSVNGGEGV